MNPNNPAVDREQAFWKVVLHRLELAASDPPLSRREAAELLAQLPPRRGAETVGDRIRRATAEARLPQRRDNVIYVNFRPLIAIQRLAADSGEEAPLPDPGRPLESADGRFRLSIAAVAGELRLTLEALGFAADDFAHRRLGVAATSACPASAMEQIVPLGSDAVIAQFTLNADGDGVCTLPDTPENRRVLLQPVIGLIEDDG